MATWGDLVAYVKAEYRVIEERSGEIRILVEFDDDRSQIVNLWREVLDQREEWVQLASACGVAAKVDLRQLLVEVGATSVVGGAAIVGEHVVVRHALPLENLDINELVDPLALIAGTADELEEKF